MKKIKKIIIAILVIFFVGFFFWQRSAKKSKEAIESIKVTRGDVQEVVSDSGELVPEEYADLFLNTGMRVKWIGVEVGDRVKKGQELLKVDQRQLAAEISMAKKDLADAISQEQLARRHWDDLKPEQRQQYRHAVERARSALSAVQSQWAYSKLISPLDGIVTQQNGRIGMAGTAVANKPVIRIINPDKLHIEVLMSESDVVRMEVGEKAEITFDAFDDEKFEAKITRIDPEAETLQDVTYYNVVLELDKKDQRFRSGMNVDVDIVVAEEKNVLQIPLRFVRKDDQGTYVYVRKEPGFAKKYITTGLEGDNGSVEVVSGLSESEEVFYLSDEEVSDFVSQ